MNAITIDPIDPRHIIAAIIEEVEISELNIGDDVEYKTDTTKIKEDFNFVHLIPYLDRYDLERQEEYWLNVQIIDENTLNIYRLDKDGL